MKGLDLTETIKQAGVVGAGGAGFPTHVKVSSKAEYLILNAAECEPLLRVDQNLIMLYCDEIIQGLLHIASAIGASKTFIGIKAKHSDVIEKLNSSLSADDNIEICSLGDFYPAGDEQTLVNEVTSRVVPEAGIPLKVGCIVVNVETVLNIYNAINGQPVTSTWLTITGEVPKPVTLRLPIGLSVKEALRLSGLNEFNGIKVIDGGPMMGKIIKDLDEPITKTTKGLIVLSEDTYLIRRKMLTTAEALRQSKASCLQCRMCTDLCPRYLLGHNMQPHIMMRKSNFDRGSEPIGAETASLCCECGVCDMYACPVGLSPRLININYKQKLSQGGIKYTPSKSEFNVRDVREYRKVPVKRLIARLGLKQYDVPAPVEQIDYSAYEVRIPLKQHIGAPCIPTVRPGQMVNAGDIIGEIPDGALGARLHASISGEVVEVSKYITIKSI